MVSRILCPTDGSDHATIGVRLAAEFQATGGRLTVCVVNIAHGGAPVARPSTTGKRTRRRS